MVRALELARRGQGYVEPNPLVGCVIADADRLIAEGWHTAFGRPHAEAEALRAAGQAAAGATLYATLEPCCHFGKTPPCADAILRAGVSRVVVAHQDPFPAVAGGGIGRLRQAGIQVEVGLCQAEAQELNAPFLKLVHTRRPWLIAKWAMTLDGKIATRTGHSRWISGEPARARAHQLRGRVDAVMIGRRTAELDDPLLTARPSGPRLATRIVVDSRAALSPHSQLARTARDAPVLIAAGPHADPENCRRLRDLGCEVWRSDEPEPAARLLCVLDELGARRMTNVLVEGGGELLGSLFDAGQIDEVHVFIAAKLIGGRDARPPLAGWGVAQMAQAQTLANPAVEQLGEDIYVHGRLVANQPSNTTGHHP